MSHQKKQNSSTKTKNQGGLTLLEISLTLSLVVFMLGLSTPLLWSAVTQNDLDASVQITVHSLRRAQSLSMFMAQDTRWGVKLTDSKSILFAGNSFDSRNEQMDEIFEFPKTLNYNGPTEFVFQKLSGLPEVHGSLILGNQSDQSKTITINPLGVIEY
ncbi:MAG: hypothetical protein JNN11_03260 [Candidatus Doudnabacteria bacterium]|nr:hypothetical protein [Candidatus Doudnabacteria bacterium]